MSMDESPADPLVDAIAQFRLELIEWIDLQLNNLCQRDAWPGTVPMAGGTEMTAPVRLESQATAPRSNAVANDPRASAASLASSPQADTAQQADSTHRLDALARRLGERIRQSEESRKGT